MMVSVYLDTSVINFLFAEDAPELKNITVDFFNNFVLKGVYPAFISEFVLQEILQTNNLQKREQLVEAIESYGLQMMEIDDYKRIDDLADAYISGGAIPEKK